MAACTTIRPTALARPPTNTRVAAHAHADIARSRYSLRQAATVDWVFNDSGPRWGSRSLGSTHGHGR